MNKIKWGAVVTALLFLAMAYTLGIATGRAITPESSWDELQRALPTVSELDLATYAWSMCDALERGQTPDEARAWLADEPARHVQVQDFADVLLAHTDVCK